MEMVSASLLSMAALDGGEPTSAVGCPSRRQFNQIVLERWLGTLSVLVHPILPVAYFLIRSVEQPQRGQFAGHRAERNGP